MSALTPIPKLPPIWSAPRWLTRTGRGLPLLIAHITTCAVVYCSLRAGGAEHLMSAAVSMACLVALNLGEWWEGRRFIDEAYSEGRRAGRAEADAFVGGLVMGTELEDAWRKAKAPPHA